MEKHISWLTDAEQELEKAVLAAYSDEEVRKHLEYFTTLTRIAGTEDELKAAEYIRDKLTEYGLEAEIQEFDAYISHPAEAELTIISPVQESFPALSHAFIVSTPPGGMEAELIAIGKGLAEDYQGVDARGKIVLIKPGSGEEQVNAARLAEEKGALAQIHITSGRPRSINIMQLRNTWGSPTVETLSRVPGMPGISICSEDGERLAALAKNGPVRARLKAKAWRGYRKIRHPLGFLRGTREPEKYVLFAAHYCSWYVGATDNAAANALLLEMARIFAKFRDQLGRSIRFAWWAGHSQGTFAGSTWYLDNFWDDVRDNAVAYLVMDGLGRAGSAGFEPRNTEEIRKFHEQVVKDALGLETKSNRVSKSGDQSYWGMGLPSFTGSPVFPKGPAADPAGKKGWYSHTEEDTLDKVDRALLTIPFRVNATSILRLCNNAVLPLEFVTVAELYKKGLKDLQEDNKSSLDLTPLLAQVEELENKARSLNEAIGQNLALLAEKGEASGLKSETAAINACLMGLGRLLLPLLSSRAGRYGQDPMGTKFKPIPALQALRDLHKLDPASEAYQALATSLRRERNRVSDTLAAANRLLQNTLNSPAGAKP